MLRRTYDWAMRVAASPHAERWLGVLSFAEGVFFPIPPDVILMPMVLANRERAWRYAVITVIASVIGGTVGYSIGYFLHPVGVWLLALTGNAGSEATFQSWYGQWGVLLLALPIPYKLMAIASGLFKLNLPLFLGASLFIRGLRFFAVAGLIRAYGPPIREFIEQRLVLVTSAVALAVIGLVVVIKVLL